MPRRTDLYDNEIDEPTKDKDVEIAEQEEKRSKKIKDSGTPQEQKQELKTLLYDPELYELYHTTLNRLDSLTDDYQDIKDIFKYEETFGPIDTVPTRWTAEERILADELILPIYARTRYYDPTEGSYQSTLGEFQTAKLNEIAELFEAQQRSHIILRGVYLASVFLENFIKDTIFSSANFLGWMPLAGETLAIKEAMGAPQPESFNFRWGLLRSGVEVEYQIIDEENIKYKITITAKKLDFPGQIEYLCGELGRDFITFNSYYEYIFNKALAKILDLKKLKVKLKKTNEY